MILINIVISYFHQSLGKYLGQWNNLCNIHTAISYVVIEKNGVRARVWYGHKYPYLVISVTVALHLIVHHRDSCDTHLHNR